MYLPDQATEGRLPNNNSRSSSSSRSSRIHRDTTRQHLVKVRNSNWPNLAREEEKVFIGKRIKVQMADVTFFFFVYRTHRTISNIVSITQLSTPTRWRRRPICHPGSCRALLSRRC